jgi:hypothetical protein
MDITLLERKFEAMGARVKVTRDPDRRSVALNIRKDNRGEYFDLLVEPAADLLVLDLQPRERHLLLMSAVPASDDRVGVTKSKYLCGHDERSWFVAAVPERGRASTVRTAMDALKPWNVREAESRLRVSGASRYRRKNRAFKRQGEWFFVPAPSFNVPAEAVLRNEPLRRTGGKAHRAEFAYRDGGRPVMVNWRDSRAVLTVAEFNRRLARGQVRREDFRQMFANANVWVRGKISHPDHRTITLHGWHAVSMNTEGQAEARRNVVFLD